MIELRKKRSNGALFQAWVKFSKVSASGIQRSGQVEIGWCGWGAGGDSEDAGQGRGVDLLVRLERGGEQPVQRHEEHRDGGEHAADQQAGRPARASRAAITAAVAHGAAGGGGAAGRGVLAGCRGGPVRVLAEGR